MSGGKFHTKMLNCNNMGTNILKALLSLRNVTDFSLSTHYGSTNRMNNMGIALEYFVKDVFCNSLDVRNISDKNRRHSNYLSYIGNANNPPDFMIREGDAVEVKKIINPRSGLALNSSYPKHKLYRDNPLITDICRQCEEWKVKDIIYAVGVVQENSVGSLWFVYGDCYAADKNIYERIRTGVVDGINSIEGVEFSITRELGRVNRVDPLGITYLRIRGMWGIENPTRVFDYLTDGWNEIPRIVSLMREEKYNSFPQDDRSALEQLNIVDDVQIRNPDNPAAFLVAKIIKF